MPTSLPVMPDQHPNIRSARLTLLPFRGDDAIEAFPCITPTLARFMDWEPAPSLRAFEAVWQGWLANMAGGSEFVFTIRRADDSLFLGLAGLHHADTTAPELGIWIREDCHGHAYGREAVTAVAHWALANLAPSHLVYPVAEQNWPSRRIAESLGGVVVGQATTRKYERLIYRIPAGAAARAPNLLR
ncbi:GNAT family N-acetyltransferase [Cupriavidus sp. TMH.W2]|uniref:GNAT family N-acetyltransferase n=1 Tax=Cupriavidus sp. TMH.W2 TaxID=3434465 RepID=UPI003D76B7A4